MHPAGGDYGSTDLQVRQDIALQTAEERFTIFGKNTRNGPSVALDNQLVSIDYLAACPFPQSSRQRRFPAAHKTDQDNVVHGIKDKKRAGYPALFVSKLATYKSSRIRGVMKISSSSLDESFSVDLNK